MAVEQVAGSRRVSIPTSPSYLSPPAGGEEIELRVRRSSWRISPSSPSFFQKSLSKDPILGASNWRGDVETFSSAVFAQPDSRNARVIKIQARKSKKLPFRHEFLLVYIIVDGKMKVMRVDRLGKIGGIFGSGEGRKAALEEVKMFDLEDENADAWLYDNGNCGSVPIATLLTRDPYEQPYSPTTPSTFTKLTNEFPQQVLSLADIARILCFIQAEMPTYVLTTKNCFMMTRSILMILCNCFGDSQFICYLGDETSPEGPVSAGFLVEPLYNGIVRWYLPVVLTGLVAYILFMLGIHWLLEAQPFYFNKIDAQRACDYYEAEGIFDCLEFVRNAAPKDVVVDSAVLLRHGGIMYLHAALDIPFPCAVIHWWLTKMEKEIRKVCEGLRHRMATTGLDGLDSLKDSLHTGADQGSPQRWNLAFVGWLALLLAIVGSVILGKYWDKGFLIGMVLFCVLFLVCVSQGDGISGDVESYVRLEDNNELDV
ncbi:hypothetical protein BDV93DRAFT_553048 [Ceratobasidium sp. AG-I]|nr:hypothetical protein BDV93DRAFT_553048 [Ceratobasidium sp. AG-I]